MAGGRKTQTFTLKEKTLPPWTVNGSVTSRNLGKSKLAGVIFGCKHNTMKECLSEQLFGLPAHHFSYVQYIEPGLPLFLFNYSDRKLHGIFEATSKGNLNIKPYAWTADGMDYTPYAAQVKIQTHILCDPLTEDQFRHAISDNYFESKHFWFELDQGQTDKLIALFSSSPVLSTISSSRRMNNVSKAINVREDIVHVEGLASNKNVPDLGSKKKWSSLFLASTTGALDDQEDLKKLQFESNRSSYAWESSCISQEEKEIFSESPEDDSGTPNEPVVLNSRNEICSSYSDDKVEGVGDKVKSTSPEGNGPCSSHWDGEWDTPCMPSQLSKIEKNLRNLDAIENMEDVHFGIAENLLPDNQENTQASLTRTENYSSFEGNSSLDLKSPSCQLVTQLLTEVRELKRSHLKQSQTIKLLEQELAGSKLQIQSLKGRYEMLDGGIRPINDNSEIKMLRSAEKALGNHDVSVLVVGGFDGSSWLSNMNCYHPSRDVMESFPGMNSVRSHASLAKLNGEVHVLGGAHGGLWYDTVESYCFDKHQWVTQPSLNRKKGGLAAAVLNDKVFAIGGGDGVECFSEVEMFDLDAGKWIQSPSMRHERFAFAASEVNGILYAVGGFDGEKYLRSAEMFDPREKSWRQIASMSTNRGCHCLAVLKEKIYALGGYDGDGMTHTVEVFDPRLGSWTTTKAMNESRGYSASAVIGEAIYVFGGLKNGKEFADRVECYKENGVWELTNLSAFGKRCFFAAVVL